MPGNAVSASAAASGVPSRRAKASVGQAWASAIRLSARRPMMPSEAMSSRLAAAMRSGVGNSRPQPSGASARGSPKRSTERPASVRAAATVTCWPSTARTLSSKRSRQPGSLCPGTPPAPSAAPIASGSASRSSQRRSSGSRDPTAGHSVAESSTLTSPARSKRTRSQPAWRRPAWSSARERVMLSASTRSTPATARGARNASTPATS
mmetsp:Transcript_6678/g.27927  ORF Transcript_6678/g.27927 Transcript_6678/m.27927 type:complete len:208 (+) Transcript_6678:772-1395(+)